MYERLVAPAASWIARTSRGKATLRVQPIHRWRRMRYWPDDVAALNGYIRTVLETARKEHDGLRLSDYDIVYVVAARRFSRETTRAVRNGMRVADDVAHHVVTFDSQFSDTSSGVATLLHETLHLFGLPDIYTPRWRCEQPNRFTAPYSVTTCSRAARTDDLGTEKRPGREAYERAWPRSVTLSFSSLCRRGFVGSDHFCLVSSRRAARPCSITSRSTTASGVNVPDQPGAV